MEECQSLVDFVKRRVEGWQGQNLSFRGRIELIHTVVAAVVMFWLQSTLLSQAMIRKLERLCADFVWRGGIHAISWDMFRRPMSKGGVRLAIYTVLEESGRHEGCLNFLQGESLWAK